MTVREWQKARLMPLRKDTSNVTATNCSAMR